MRKWWSRKYWRSFEISQKKKTVWRYYAINYEPDTLHIFVQRKAMAQKRESVAKIADIREVR